jgi:hypothetical protein
MRSDRRWLSLRVHEKRSKISTRQFFWRATRLFRPPIYNLGSKRLLIAEAFCDKANGFGIQCLCLLVL